MRTYLVLGLLVLAVFAFKCGTRPSGDTGEKVPNAWGRYDKAPIRGICPNGTPYRSEQPLTADDCDAIKTGLDRLFAKNAAVGYTRHPTTPRHYGDYEIAVLKPDRTQYADGYIATFEVPTGSNYAGSVYDHPCAINPAKWCISSAEQLLYCQEGGPNVIAIGDYDRSFETMANVVMFGGEHCTLLFEDGQKYLATETHVNGGHPIY